MAKINLYSQNEGITSDRIKHIFGDDLHPKIVELAIKFVNEKYTSSNNRAIAML